MKQYLDLCQRVIDEGEMIYNKRTGKNTLTVINADLEYNVSGGEFPLLTTRKSFYKAAIAEFLGYIRGYDSAADFRKLGTPTWNANANENKTWLSNPYRKGEDDMGVAYRFRTLGYFEPTYTLFKEKPTQQMIIYKKEMLSDEIKDLYYPEYFNIACIGNLEGLDDNTIEILKPVWQSMISKCYGDSDSDIFVCDEWLIFENFVKDFQKIHNWELKLIFPEEYFLDKDWVNSNYYSKETVRWSTKKELSINSKSTNTFIATNKENNEKEYFKSANSFVEKYNLSKEFCNQIGSYKEGDIFTYKNWDIEIINHKSIRYIEVDQLKLIYAKLKLGIDDRRLIMDAWYPHTAESTCLMPCMYAHTFSLVGDTLHLTSYQRSADLPLGIAFNMPQVYVFLALMAQITGKKPGKAYHKIINAHIYEDQIELMKNVQLKRKPYPTPKLWINPEIKSLEDLETWVTMDDFKVEDYEYHDPIKYPFSV